MPFFTSHDGTRIHFDEVGDGPPLLALPGGPGTDVRYLGDLGGLAAGRRLIRMDARAAGRSEVPGDRATVSFVEQARDIEELRRFLGLTRMDVLAHSAGTLTAQEYAVAHPGRVRRLVLVTPVGRAAREPDAAELAALRASRAGEPWYEAAAAADPALRAGGLSREAEVIAPARLVATTYPDSRLEVIPEAGHRPWAEQPDLFRTLVDGFLSAEARSE
ncbi:alpha/beta hydrolase [Actinoplanes sp. NBC_00393]|uniref:alpha/beta fold hydrolase n=1 Tax=Actinoplanes sp. NBC_00393 TaxID=2975953 RepID=UPI002E1E1995